jgi:hypothetical protein
MPIAAAAAFTPGCSSEEFENICGWIKDPDNCYSSFREETGDRCAVVEAEGGPKSTFASRDKLDVCFLGNGGQVVFDPPLDLAEFPLKKVSFKRIDALAKECGSVTFDGQYSYSVTVDGCSDADTDAGATKCTDGTVAAGAGRSEVAGGTVAITTPEGRDVYDVSCADGTKHHFNRLDTEKCPDHAQLLPRAELESNAGGQPDPNETDTGVIEGFAGSISFRVYYPPTQPTLDAEGIVADTQPEAVEYFNCEIPAAAPLCFNGVKDGAETDVDCGGAVCTKNQCGEGQACIQSSDCSSGMCALTDGLRKCQGDGGGGSGSGGSGSGGSGGA